MQHQEDPGASREPAALGYVAFWDDPVRLRALVVRGSFFTFLTLGLYRFVYVTELRRWFWGHTALGPHFLEYTGRARELLVGFLIALAVIVPLNLATFIAGVEMALEPAYVTLVFGLVFVFLVQFALFRARRYRLTRTIYRGIRFWQSGSGLAYAGRVFLWALPVLASLGLLWPLALASLERYKMRHTHFGSLMGRFEATAFGFYRSAFWLWLVILGPLLVACLVVLVDLGPGVLIELAGRGIDDPSGGKAPFPPLLAILPGALAWAGLTGFFLYPIYEACQFRWWANGIGFGQVCFASVLPATGLYSTYAFYMLMLWACGMVLSVLAALAAGIGALIFGHAIEVSKTTPITDFGNLEQGLAIGAVILFYVVGALAYAGITVIVLKRGLWRAKVASLIIKNPQAIEEAEMRAEESGAFGEGLADALDVGGF